jgi:hypothetical protein
MKFITVGSNLETGEPLWFGQDRQQQTLDEFSRTQPKESQRKRIAPLALERWEHARCSEGQTLAAVDVLDESGHPKRQQLNQLFALSRRVMKAYLLKESLGRLWTYRYEGALLRHFESWIDQLRWPRLAPFQKPAFMLLDHLNGILNYCRTKVRFGVVEAINGNIKTILGRGRGYKYLGYLLRKTQCMAVTKTAFIVL